jgi:hypothetical protein
VFNAFFLPKGRNKRSSGSGLAQLPLAAARILVCIRQFGRFRLALRHNQPSGVIFLLQQQVQRQEGGKNQRAEGRKEEERKSSDSSPSCCYYQEWTGGDADQAI